ncbi:MAG: AAA family ATPase, partial [Patescibacteria group bacterium]
MFERNLEKELKKWKDSPIRKVLILRGARQVGKTSVVRKFGAANFDQVVEINLEQKEQRQWLDGVVSIADFAIRIELYWKKVLKDRHTLLFIDEVQESSSVLALLRFFAEERPELHVIVAGSLLEAKMAGNWSVPVGRVEYMYLYPLTFFEYLTAIGQSQWRSYGEKLKMGEKIIGSDQLKKLFLEYMLVGGLPEAVASIAKGQGIGIVMEIQERLFSAYNEDISKYAHDTEKKYVDLVMRTAPKLAGGLFKYENMGSSGYRGREVREAVETLEKIMLLTQIKAVNTTSLPLFFKPKRAKKMIWLDIGLVNLANKSHQTVFEGTYQGRLMEQVVGQTLVAGGVRKKTDVYYWARNRDLGSAEVDFVIQSGGQIVAMEVKSGKMREMKSLFSMMESDPENVIPVRVS